MASQKVLIVDDEKDIAYLISDYLQMEGFDTIIAEDGEKALEKYKQNEITLVILDIMIPKIDGMEVCRRIRSESTVPVIMLSAKTSDVDKIVSLGLGADDYMTKPFSLEVLLARVRAHIRRYTKLSVPSKFATTGVLDYGSLKVDIDTYTVYVKGKKIDLTAKEFELVSYLAQNPNQVLTREQIFTRIWGFEDSSYANTVTVHIRRVREKIEKNPSDPQYIRTVWGVGYKFVGDRR